MRPLELPRVSLLMRIACSDPTDPGGTIRTSTRPTAVFRRELVVGCRITVPKLCLHVGVLLPPVSVHEDHAELRESFECVVDGLALCPRRPGTSLGLRDAS